MKYADFRSNIHSGDILAWSHREGWFSSFHSFTVNFVRLVQRSEYSHVAVAVRLAGRVFALESVTGGVRLMPLSKLLPFYHLDYQTMDIDRAMTVCGEPYSQLEAVKGFLGETNDTNAQWQCAEFVKWAQRMPCKATPSAVVSYVLAGNSKLTEIVA